MNLLGSLVEFFDIWHLREVIVVMLSHVIVHYKNLKFMEMMKAVIVHILVGVILTCLANIDFVVVGPVVLEGGLGN